MMGCYTMSVGTLLFLPGKTQGITLVPVVGYTFGYMRSVLPPPISTSSNFSNEQTFTQRSFRRPFCIHIYAMFRHKEFEPYIDDFLDTVDTDLFLEEIKKRPEIWNVTPKSNAQVPAERKRLAWLEISRIFCPGFDDKEEKERSEIGNALYKKWRNLKSNYLQSIRLGTRFTRAEQMSFYRDLTLEIRAAKTGAKSQSKNNEAESGQDPNSSQNEQTSNSSQSTVPVSDPSADRSFFESLMPMVSRYTEDEKLQFRCEILNIIQRMRRPPQQQQQQQQSTSNVSTTSMHPHPNYLW